MLLFEKVTTNTGLTRWPLWGGLRVCRQRMRLAIEGSILSGVTSRRDLATERQIYAESDQHDPSHCDRVTIEEEGQEELPQRTKWKLYIIIACRRHPRQDKHCYQVHSPAPQLHALSWILPLSVRSFCK